MKVNHRKTAASLWSAGSVMFPVTIVLYVFVYQPDVASDAERTAQLIEKWAFISAIWRLETIAVVMLAISSWYFATAEKNMSWFLITFAHIIMVTMYANMLGSYPAAAESYAEVPHLFPMVFDTAVWIFGFSNFLFLTGMTFVYLSSDILSKWIKWTGALISVIGAMGALALFFEWLTFGDLMIGGPLILILYLLNAYLGLKLAKQK
jgi:hypothetical protein